MAIRPVFINNISGLNLITRYDIEFQWFSGYSIVQKQKSIHSLHNVAKSKLNIDKILEISTKSEQINGRKLSAFNLKLTYYTKKMCVECAYQGSKIFEHGGPFNDLYFKNPSDAKKDPRLLNSGKLIGFKYKNKIWGLSPTTAFYDWLYIKALMENRELCKFLLKFEAFTDISFNPEKSFSCQAGTAAMFVSLVKRKILLKAMKNKNSFIQTLLNPTETTYHQEELSL